MVTILAVAMALIIVGAIWAGLVVGDKLAAWLGQDESRFPFRLKLAMGALGYALIVAVPVAIYNNLAPVGFALFALSLFSFNIKSSLREVSDAS
jgi:hypothetical protein